ncbi:MAG: recombinase RecA [Planctomycetaceae bacterium]|jgi:recombination protein RecA|nr:recombinase RecA [Planctomycetaceae bacterium]
MPETSSLNSGDTMAKKDSEKKVSKIETVLASNPALKNAVAAIEKEFGEGAIMPLGLDRTPSLDGISTGCLSLDLALGGFGVPKGRIIEIYGPESSGKTTLTLHIVANAQKGGGVAAFIDAEHALDPSWAKRLGVDLESLLVSQPSSGEEALNIAELLVKSNAVDIVVVDSVSALVPEKELKGEMGDASVGAQARLMSQAMRKLVPVISKSKTCLVFINQIRMKIGVMFGSPETTSGGQALKFAASCRIDVRKKEQLKDGDTPIGQRVKAKVVKNKVAPPFRVAEFDMMFADGISYEGDILDLALAQKIIVKSGAWFRYGSENIAQGREKAKQYLKDNPDFTGKIKAEIQANIESGNVDVFAAGSEDRE